MSLLERERLSLQAKTLFVRARLQLRQGKKLVEAANETGFVRSGAVILFKEDSRLRALADELNQARGSDDPERLAPARAERDKLSPAQVLAFIEIQGDQIKETMEKMKLKMKS